MSHDSGSGAVGAFSNSTSCICCPTGAATAMVVGPDGKATTSLLDTNVTLSDGPNSLFHDGGTSIVIHAMQDDYKTDPAGNSGARIACGVIQK